MVGKHSIHAPTAGLAVLAILFFVACPVAAQERPISPGEQLTLQRAVEIALKIQPSVLAARYTVRANEARIGEARSSYYPQITASGVYNRINRPSGSTTAVSGGGGSGAPTVASSSGTVFDQYTSSAGVSQMLFDFGKTASQVKVNDLAAQSSRFDLSNVQDVVVLNAKQAYYNMLQAMRNREVATQSVKQFQQHLDQARGFYEVGTKAKFDVTKAEVDLGNSQLNLINAENQVRLGRVTLNNAMGVPDAPDYSLQDNLLYAKYELPFEEALTRAYGQRSDLQSLIKKKEASREAISLARKANFPLFTGNASYYYTGTDFPLSNGWNYGVNLSVPIFSGFLITYQVAEAQANYYTVEANEQSLRLDIYSQVQQGYVALRQADESIVTTELTVKQAKENVELALGRYQTGVGSPLEVTDALVAQANAEVAYTAALTNYKNSQASIEKAIGVR